MSTTEIARETNGHFARSQEKEHHENQTKRASKKRLRTERDYLRALIQEFSLEDIAQMAAAIKSDAIDGEDPRVKNAAREMIFRGLLGGGKVQLSDVERPPAIIKRR